MVESNTGGFWNFKLTALRSFTLNLSIILCKYFLQACATMTLISQFKSKFKTDCVAMSYVWAHQLPHFISEHLRRPIRRCLPGAQPAVCQIFKYPGKHGASRGSSHQNEPPPPIFPVGFWLSCLSPCGSVTHLRGLSHSCGWIQCAASSDQPCGESFAASDSLKRIRKGTVLISGVTEVRVGTACRFYLKTHSCSK